MKEHEYKAIRQRLAVNIDNHADAVALAAEVALLRLALHTIRGMTGDPAILRTVNDAIGE